MERKSFIKRFIPIWVYLGIGLGMCLIALCRLLTGYSQNTTETIFFIISDISSCFGLFYVILNNVKLKIALYAGIIVDAGLVIVTAQQKIYLSTLFYACYAIPSLIIGLVNWDKNKTNSLTIKLTKKTFIFLPIIFVTAYAFTILFSYLVGSSAIFLDGLVICFAGVGLFFLSSRSFLQWPAFILGDTFCACEYLFLVSKNHTMLSLLIMVCFYLINDIIGFFNWLSDIKISNKKDIFYIITKNK